MGRRWPGDQAGRQSLELEAVAVSDRFGDRWGAGLSTPDQALGEAVEEPGQQTAAPEPRPARQALEDFWLDGEADGQARALGERRAMRP